MSRVYIKIPKTGLGNILLVWAKGKVFAEINHLPLTVSAWWAFRWGTWIRNERKKRLYRGYFKEHSWFSRQLIKLRIITSVVIKEPPIVKMEQQAISGNKLFYFNAVITNQDLFAPLREHRRYIKEEIYRHLSNNLKKRLNKYPHPEIAVHIRRGDFKLGNHLTPLSFFIECIHTIRKASNELLAVTVFSDAEPEEINEILMLPAVSLAEEKPDILDILLMSTSKVIVLSQSSTFSYWAAFLSDAIIVMNKNDWQKHIRDTDGSREIRIDASDDNDRELLACAIRLHQKNEKHS